MILYNTIIITFDLPVLLCQPLSADDNGYYTPSICETDPELDNGVICSPGCDAGYNLINNQQLECQTNGQWSHTISLPFCECKSKIIFINYPINL